MRHPSVGLIFMSPGTRNTLRIRGRASIVRDDWVRERMEVNGTIPAPVLDGGSVQAFTSAGVLARMKTAARMSASVASGIIPAKSW